MYYSFISEMINAIYIKQFRNIYIYILSIDLSICLSIYLSIYMYIDKYN